MYGCGVGEGTCSKGGLDIASKSKSWSSSTDQVTDRCGTARLGGQVCPVDSGSLAHQNIKRVSCDDERLDPAQGRDLLEMECLCSAHGPANGSWLFGVGISCGRLPAFLCRQRVQSGLTNCLWMYVTERLVRFCSDAAGRFQIAFTARSTC